MYGAPHRGSVVLGTLGDRHMPKHPFSLVRVVIMLLLLGCAQLALAVASGSEEQTSSRVIRYDFGVVPAGRAIEHTFHVDNPTNRDVAVAAIRAACSCTTVGENPKVIPANKGADFHIRVQTNDAIGERQWTIRLELVGESPVTLIAQGKVVALYPKTVQLGAMRRGQEVVKEFVVRCVPGDRLRIIGVDYDVDEVSVGFSRLNEAEVSVSVRTKVIPEGPFDIPLVIRTSAEPSNSMSIRLQGRVLKRLEVENGRVVLRGTRDDNVIRGQFRLYAPYGDGITVQEVSSSNPAQLDVRRVEPSKKDGGIMMEVLYRVSNTDVDAFVQERIVVKAIVGGDPYSEEVLILGLVRKEAGAKIPEKVHP